MTRDEIVETMARAACTAYGDDFDAQPRDLDALREWRRREGGDGHVRSHDPGLPTQRDWLDFQAAALSALEAKGMVLAPEKPTEAMVSGALDVIVGEDHGGNIYCGVHEAKEVYRAMLSAFLNP